jgi:hypothetical protein
MSFIQSEIERGNLELASAVIHTGSPWTAGLTPQEQDIAKSFADEKFAGRANRQRAALAAIKQTVDTALMTFAGGYQKMLQQVQPDAAANAISELQKAG